MEREEKEELSRTLGILTTKIDELICAIKDKNETTEGKIRENPLAYITGAFAGVKWSERI